MNTSLHSVHKVVTYPWIRESAQRIRRDVALTDSPVHGFEWHLRYSSASEAESASVSSNGVFSSAEFI